MQVVVTYNEKYIKAAISCYFCMFKEDIDLSKFSEEQIINSIEWYVKEEQASRRINYSKISKVIKEENIDE